MSSPVLTDDNQKSKKDAVNKIIRVGSRKSELALVQTNYVISLLQKIHPHQKFEIHKMTTVGDRVLNISLPKIGEKSLFTKDLEDALKCGVVDFVVHSLKDLPTVLPDGMAIGAVLEREDARDALVLAKKHEGKCFKTLPEGSVIGTSSLRRTAQLSRLYPHLKIQDIRGNLNTRLAKLDAADSVYAGIVLAQAGLVRLGWQHRISHTIDPDEILYAVGQGALAVECRSSDVRILTMLQKLVCHQTQCRILAERSFLKTLGGGCSAPVAVDSILGKRKDIDDLEKSKKTEYELRLIGSVWSLDGKTEIQSENSCFLNMKVEKNIDDDDDEEPLKKIKLSIEAEDANKVCSESSSPPRIVDHLKLSLSATNASDLAPNLSIVQNSLPKVIVNARIKNASESSDDQSLKCPLNFAVGEDVMGQCPYFDPGNSIEDITKMASFCGGCPYKNGCGSINQSNDNSTQSPSDKTKCPISSNMACSSKDSITSTTKHSSNENATEQLFCGVYPHVCWPLEVFEKCEQLGKDLAVKLIEKGALAVMECAQSEIRSKA